QFITMLADAGLPVVEATSFVSPRAIPQLSDASEVMARLRRIPTTEYPVLVPNLKGMERALAAGVTSVAVFTAASESFTRHNINATIAQSLANFRPVVDLARQAGVFVRGYISTVFGCPYEGPVAAEKVLAVAQALLEMGISVLDSSAGGLGGCPYAPGAAGNLATEDLLYMLHGMGISTGVDLEKVVAATRFVVPWLGHAPTSKYYQAAEGSCVPAQSS